MTHFVPFKYEHLKDLDVQERHKATLHMILDQDPELVAGLTEAKWSSTAYTGGESLACYGILPNGEGWAFLAKDLRRDMIAVTRHARGQLALYVRDVGPTWIKVDPKFPEGLRWAELLGYHKTADGNWTISQ